MTTFKIYANEKCIDYEPPIEPTDLNAKKFSYTVIVQWDDGKQIYQNNEQHHSSEFQRACQTLNHNWLKNIFEREIAHYGNLSRLEPICARLFHEPISQEPPRPKECSIERLADNRTHCLHLALKNGARPDLFSEVYDGLPKNARSSLYKFCYSTQLETNEDKEVFNEIYPYINKTKEQGSRFFGAAKGLNLLTSLIELGVPLDTEEYLTSFQPSSFLNQPFRSFYSIDSFPHDELEEAIKIVLQRSVCPAFHIRSMFRAFFPTSGFSKEKYNEKFSSFFYSSPPTRQKLLLDLAKEFMDIRCDVTAEKLPEELMKVMYSDLCPPINPFMS